METNFVFEWKEFYFLNKVLVCNQHCFALEVRLFSRSALWFFMEITIIWTMFLCVVWTPDKLEDDKVWSHSKLHCYNMRKYADIFSIKSPNFTQERISVSVIWYMMWKTTLISPGILLSCQQYWVFFRLHFLVDYDDEVRTKI